MRRIFGLENEYGTIFMQNGKRVLDLKHVVRYLFRFSQEAINFDTFLES